MIYFKLLLLNRGRRFIFHVLAIFLPLALISCGVAYYFYYSMQERSALRNYGREKAAIEISRNVIGDVLQEIRRDLLGIAGNYALKTFLDQPMPAELFDFEQDLLNIAVSSRLYDQIRWLDETGMERVRINFNNGNPVITPVNELQNKQARYYFHAAFKAAFKLEHGQVYLSPLDLNIEHGLVQIPYKPMLRIATPVFDRRGNKRGIVLLNYLGAEMLARFEKTTASIADHAMLLNQDGYWLKSSNPGEDWGFMFGRGELTFARRHPAAWQRMLAVDSGQFEDAEGLWTFNTLYPGLEGQKTPERNAAADRASFWKVVAHLPPRTLYGGSPLLKPLLAALASLLIVEFTGSWKLVRLRHLRDAAYERARQASRNLERRVEERTLQLQADINLRERVEKMLHAKEFMLSESQRIAHVGSWQVDLPMGKIIWSEETYRIYGLSPETFNPDMESFYDLIHADDRPAMREWIHACLAGRQPGDLEFRAVLPNNGIRILSGRGDMQYDHENRPVGMIGTVQDITERKQAEVAANESAARIRAILDTVVDGIITIDKRGIVETFNPAAEHIFGHAANDVIGRNVKMLMPEPYRSRHDRYIERYLAGGEAKIVEIGRMVEGRRKDGSIFPLELAVSEMRLGEGRMFIGLVRDITERKNAEDKLKQALGEKEVLLKEVYHRVKNNLQIVSSLINLQAKNVKNKAAVELLKQSADRIKSMALLHEKLYQSKDLAKIDFNDYIHSLADHLMFGYGAHSSRIKINLQIDAIFLDVDTAIPCGLIINELISNALKHAFPDDRHGEIGIAFRQDVDEFILVITDNGIGFPAGLDFKKSASLGLQLVSSLTNQLLGQLTLDQGDGSTFTLRFTHLS